MEGEILGAGSEGAVAGAPVNQTVSDSWDRCWQAGLNRSDKPRSAVLLEPELRIRREQNQELWKLAQTELQELFTQVAGANYVVAFADRTGTILEAIHDEEFSSSSASRMVIPGSVWQEDIRGTNALGLTLATKKATVVDGSEHFLDRFDNISCFASPVRNTRNEVVGVIDASTDARSRGRHTLALVKLAAANVENNLFKAEQQGALILGFHARPEYLNTTSSGLLALSEEGFIVGANGSAQEMLSGFDLTEPVLFERLFDIRFSALLQEVLTQGTATVKDRMQSTVHFTIKEIGHLMRYIDKVQFSVGPSGNERPTKSAWSKRKSEQRVARKSDCRDTVIVEQLTGLTKRLTASPGTVLCSGPQGSGKSVICRELLERLSPRAPFVEIDCTLINEDNYEQLLFGTAGRLGFFEPEFFSPDARGAGADAGDEGSSRIPPAFSGKIHKSAQGMLYLRNFDAMPETMAEDLLRVVRAIEHEQVVQEKFHRLLPRVLVLSTQKPLDSQQDPRRQRLAELLDEIGEELTIPPLNERLDLDYVIRSVTHDIDAEKIITVEAERILAQHYWVTGFRGLRKAMRQIIRNCPGKYIRTEHLGAFLRPTDDDCQPCQNCSDTVIKRNKCLTIRKSWRDNNGNVSMVSRKLGLSRTTIYAHISRSDAFTEETN